MPRRGADNRFPGHPGSGGGRVVCLPVELNLSVLSHDRGQMNVFVFPFDLERWPDKTSLNQVSDGDLRHPRVRLKPRRRRTRHRVLTFSHDR